MGIYLRMKSNNKLKTILLAWSLVIFVLAGCQPKTVADRALNGNLLHQVWKQEVGGPLNHPPLRVGDVLIAAPIRSPLAGLDVETGKVLWQYDPGIRIWDRAYATDGQRVFVGLDGGKFAALDASTGKTIWETELGINVQVPPLAVSGVVYAATTFAGPGMIGDPNGKAKLFALSAEDGHVLWEFESDNYILQSPFRQGDTIYLAGSFSNPKVVDEGGHMRLYALDASDGSVKWKYESEDGFTKQVYATESAVAYIAYQDFTVGVDSSTGELLWRLDTGNWVPTLAGVGNTIYYGSANTVVHAVNADTGDVLWQFNIPEGTFNYLLGAPVQAGNELVFLTQLGEVMALDLSTGELRWRISTGIVGARMGLSISGGWLFIGDAEGAVYGYTDQ